MIKKRLKEFYDTQKIYFDCLDARNTRQFAYYMPALAPAKSGRFLDIGCGTGFAAVFLAKYGFSGVGVDISGIGTRMAKKSAHKEGVSTLVEFGCADAEKLPFRDNIFDAVGSCETLEHLYNPEQCFREMLRVLKPGGKLVIRCPNKLVALDVDRMKIKKFYNYLSYKNLIKIIHKFLDYKRGNLKMEYRKPNLGKNVTGSDEDAVYLPNPFDILHLYESEGVLIKFFTTHGFMGNSRIRNIARRIMKHMPVLKYCGDPVFIIGYKGYVNPEMPLFDEKIYAEIKEIPRDTDRRF